MVYKSVEVTKKQYNVLRVKLAGLIFHEKTNGKYLVTPAIKQGLIELERYLDNN